MRKKCTKKFQNGVSQKVTTFLGKQKRHELVLIIMLVVVAVLTLMLLFVCFELLMLREATQAQNALNSALHTELSSVQEQLKELKVASNKNNLVNFVCFFASLGIVCVAVYCLFSGISPSADVTEPVNQVAKVVSFREESAGIDWFIHSTNDEVTDVYMKSVRDTGEPVKGSQYIREIVNQFLASAKGRK